MSQIGRNQVNRRRKITGTLNQVGNSQHLNLLAATTDTLVMPDLASDGGGSGVSQPIGSGSGATSDTTVYELPPTAPTTDTNVSLTPIAEVSSCPNPGTASMASVSNAVSGSVRTQVFRINAPVNPGFVYGVGTYSVLVTVVAVDGDTKETINAKLIAQINSTPLSFWNQYGSNNNNYKPIANSVSADSFAVTCDSQHSFISYVSGSCSAPTPVPEPAPTPVPTDTTPTPAPEPVPTTEPTPTYYEPPYSEVQIDAMSCSTLATAIEQMKADIAAIPFTGGTDKAIVYNAVLQYMEDRYNTACKVPSATDTITPPVILPFPIPFTPGGGGSGGGSASGSKAIPGTSKAKNYFWMAIGVGLVAAYFTFAGGSIVKD